MCILLTTLSEFNFLQYPSFDHDKETSTYRFVSCLGRLWLGTRETSAARSTTKDAENPTPCCQIEIISCAFPEIYDR